MQFPRASALADVHFAVETGSTFELVDHTAPDWTCWTTLNQTAGRARVDRRWETPPGQALATCLVVRPSSGHSWMPLVTGLALARTIDELVEATPAIKWPNDVMIDGRKISGILCELRGDVIVVGFGVNLVQRAEVLLETATSLRQEGGTGEAESLADAVLAGVVQRLRLLVPRLGTEALLQEVSEACSTLGQRVRAEMPDGTRIVGAAARLDADGGLVIATDAGERSVTAGDIVHLRPERTGPGK
ncbi:MAG TPA: biotin--[acetyl-CoA-carboxylase] ligase [Candidatus Agrococcus pullicola]|uniref:biotin--[biotin carboxyl-carrier protein] ligase n=1 Tax=Candidatus Agrococcus pullicola TaxID=2838429 RepID=A0A9D1YTY6_9MICO|nr:biotin--[acetyl-CoA-carboxylase] ligase [Candidatus Agrococcus pullicola]